jgi:hypothetical protein
MSSYLDSLKWDSNGLVAVIVQVGIGVTAAHPTHCTGR